MAFPKSPTTLLSIDGIDFSDYATRNISVVLQPIATGSLRRDVNGNLVDMTLPQFRKYRVEVLCSDHEVPNLNDIWRGKEVEVTLIPGLGVEDSSGVMTLTMMVVEWTTDRKEWEAQGSWHLVLLEK